ncbi:hypothetical protein ACQPZQ_20440 [Pseudonocardia sp. CA-142604]|uniref:hypothetical protein n=1 Tax=Pseudonocardia sp. CA-142604 TaxID=3240024 RepID=UPI003D90FA72
MSGASVGDWLRETRQRITAKDIFLVVAGAAIGFGLDTLIDNDPSLGALMLAAAGLAVVSGISVARLRSEAATALHDAQEAAAQQLAEVKSEIDDHHAQLREELEAHLDYVHAAVFFVEEARRNGRGRRGQLGYDTATAAVRQARNSIFVIGDYSPPPDEGPGFTRQPPAKRSEYLSAIETILTDRLNAHDASLPRLVYRRYVQRPLDIYNGVKSRETASQQHGIILTRDDMAGDEQIFEHCQRILDIKASADRIRGAKVDIDLRLIPFLPNCPSLLLVDRREMQFTIPTRIDQPGDHYGAALGLHGVLVMHDHARGAKVCGHFEDLFMRLKDFSVFIKGVSAEDSMVVTAPQSAG